ncbi:MAG TPA: HD-GYP domain-containing protein [Gammaproteobacteria bacterium]
MERKIDSKDLVPGMYVTRLDRPWIDTPFLFQGFRVETYDDILTVQKYCEYVYVDEERKGEEFTPLDFSPLGIEPEKGPPAKGLLPRRVTSYLDQASVEDELPRAKASVQTIGKAIHGFMEGIREGRKLDAENLERAVDDMVDSVVRNPDAMIWLSKLKNLDNYAYDHAIVTSVLAVMFGRHLGMSRKDLGELGLAGLLFDIGKVRLPPNLLTKPGKLSEEEFEEARRHVEYGTEILAATEGMPARVVEAARTHHERHDGKGYPQGLVGSTIPIFGRIVGIVDCYDAITTTRAYQPSISAHMAVRQLYDWRDRDFQEELLEQFIQCLGVYPTGTIVELTTGEIGIVVAQNRTRRLRPRVMLILDEDKVAKKQNPVLDLTHVATDSSGEKLEIVRSHDLGAFGIDPKAYFL